MDGEPFEDARPTLGWGLLLLPPIVAGMAWMVTLFCGGIVGLLGIILAQLLCIRLAWHVSRTVAEWRYEVQMQDAMEMLQERPSEQFVGRLRFGLFLLELLAIGSTFIGFLGVMALFRGFIQAV